VQKTEWNDAHQQVGPAKFLPGHDEIQANLFKKLHGIGCRIGFFILASTEHVEKALDRPGITPVYRGICHRGNRQIEIKRQSKQKQTAANQDGLPFRKCPTRFYHQPDAGQTGENTQQVEDAELSSAIAFERREMAHPNSTQPAQK